MPFFYEIHEPSRRGRADFEAGGVVGSVVDPDTGHRLVWTERELPRRTGRRTIERDRFDEVMRTLLTDDAPDPPGEEEEAGAALPADLLRGGWGIAAGSPRRATLNRTAQGAGVALRVALGAGRGDVVWVARAVHLPAGARQIRGRLLAAVDAEEQVSVSVVLTAPTGRPWLEVAGGPLTPGEWTEVTFDLRDVEARRLKRVGTLIVQITTEADDGYALLGALTVEG